MGMPETMGFWDLMANLAPWFIQSIFWFGLCGGVWWALDRWYFTSWDLGEELKKGNRAVAIFAGAVIFSFFFFGSNAIGATNDRYDNHFSRAGKMYFSTMLPWQIHKAQGMTESALQPTVCSPVGACGIMQFMPATARDMGLANRFDARNSIYFGVKYMRRLWSIFKADRTPADRYRFAAASYNWGAGNVIRNAQPRAQEAGANENSWAGIKMFIPEETRLYIPRISRWCQRFARRPCLI
ncbi:MAG: transglycosylase SLT domain-containing protein [Dehalococcoidales bacterium]